MKKLLLSFVLILAGCGGGGGGGPDTVFYAGNWKYHAALDYTNCSEYLQVLDGELVINQAEKDVVLDKGNTVYEGVVDNDGVLTATWERFESNGDHWTLIEEMRDLRNEEVDYTVTWIFYLADYFKSCKHVFQGTAYRFEE